MTCHTPFQVWYEKYESDTKIGLWQNLWSSIESTARTGVGHSFGIRDLFFFQGSACLRLHEKIGADVDLIWTGWEGESQEHLPGIRLGQVWRSMVPKPWGAGNEPLWDRIELSLLPLMTLSWTSMARCWWAEHVRTLLFRNLRSHIFEMIQELVEL